MGYEVFDDVAFFYVASAFLASVIFPVTGWIIYSEITTYLNERTASLKTKDSSSKFIENKLRENGAIKTESFKDKYFKKRYMLLVACWVLFFYLMTMLPSMSTKAFATFEPYSILGVEVDSDEATLRKAYRKLSLKWHPDKNPDNKEEAETQFLLISKAYTALTDPRVKANMERWGNPDGFQGYSMTYGLPEFLASKDHQILVMLLYALVVLGVPLAVYFLWVRKAGGASAHPLGVNAESVDRYVKVVNENMTNKFMLEPFCLATEFNVNASPARENERASLHALVKDKMPPVKFDKYWPAQYASTLFAGHMLRKPLGPLQQGDLPKLLAPAHSLLNAMTEIAKAQHLAKPYNAAIELMQHLTQATWFGETDLLQLPYLGVPELVALSRKNVRVMPQFRQLPEEEVRQVLGATLSEKQITEVLTVAKAIPSIDLDLKWHVPGADDICESDVVHIELQLKRCDNGWYFSGAKQRPLSAEEEEAAKKAKEDMEARKKAAADKEKEKQANDEAKSASTARESATGASAGTVSSIPTGKRRKATVQEREAEDARIDAMIENFDIFEKEERTDQFADKTAPLVHAPQLPFPKREVWYVSLMNIGPNNREILVESRVVRRFEDACDVKFMLQAPPKPGNYIFEIQVRSDSYVGVDLSARFPMVVKPAPKKGTKRVSAAAAAAARRAAGGDDDEEEEEEEEEGAAPRRTRKAKVEELDEDGNPLNGDDDDNEEESEDEEEAEELRRLAELNKADEELPGKWYFLGAGSFLEMLVNVIVLSVVGFYAYNFLHSRGLWQKWFEPTVSAVWKRAAPIVATVDAVTAPVTAPIAAFAAALFSRFLGNNAEMPDHIRREKLNKMKSQRNRRTPF